MSEGNVEQRLVEEIYLNVQNKDVSSALRSCQRLAQKSSDYRSFTYFLYEQEHGETEAFRHLCEVLGQLSKDKLKLLHEVAVKRKIRNRSIDEKTAKALGLEEGTLIWHGCGQIDAEIEVRTETISSLRIPSNINPTDAAYLYKENQTVILSEIRMRAEVVKVKERLLSAAFDYASLLEQKLVWVKNDASRLALIEDSLFSYLDRVSPSALSQLQFASNALGEIDSEAISNAANQIRRCLCSVADTLQPADSSIKGLEADKYLNRISYYFEHQNSKNSTSVKALLSVDLEKILRSVNEQASKGVHAQMSGFEFQQLYLATVLYLSNIAQLDS